MSENSRSTTYSEIGSYFWLDDEEKNASGGNGIGEWFPPVEDSSYTFCGRSAIDLALQDISASKKVRSAYLPSYLCDSMVDPFRAHNIEVRYYDVDFSDGRFVYEIDLDHSCDVVLIMSYFGLDTKEEQKTLQALKNDHTIIIEDLTHSLLCRKASSEYSDYYVAALRKSLEIPTGGWVGKKEGKLHLRPFKDGDPFTADKIRGMHEKYDYIVGRTDTKELFWKDQTWLEEYLDSVDNMLKIDSTSLRILDTMDVDSNVRRRKENAAVLRNALEDLEGKVMRLPRLDTEEDTPLFLPVFLEQELRDDLRKYLIANNVYCPVHWPEVDGAPRSVAGNELSLICDQRYGERDMLRISDLIHEWCRERDL